MIRPEEIAHVTNQVYDCLTVARSAYHPYGYGRDMAVAQALGMSCELLGRLLEYDITLEYDRALEEGNMAALHIRRELSGGAVELVSLDRAHFEGFLEREIDLLKLAGFKSVVAEHVIWHVREGISELKASQPSGLVLEGALSRLRCYVCSRAEEMALSFKRADMVQSFIYGLGGIGLISTNTGLGKNLSPIGVAASVGLGGGLVTESVKTILNHFLQHGGR